MSYLISRPGICLITGDQGTYKTALSMDEILGHFVDGDKRNLIVSAGCGFSKSGFARSLDAMGKPRAWAFQRVHILERQYCGYFWRYRLVNGKLSCKPMTCVRDEHGIPTWADIDYTGDPGMIYYLDEIDDIFSHRFWQNVSEEIGHYTDLIRRPNDIVLASCVRKKKVLIDFRDMVNTHIEMQDSARFKWFGVAFSALYKGKVFVGADARKDEELDSGRWVNCVVEKKPNPLVFQMYDTAEGPGMIGAVADKAQKRPLFTWKRLAPAVAVVLVVSVFLANRGCDAVAHFMSRKLKDPGAVVGAVVEKVSTLPATPLSVVVPASNPIVMRPVPEAVAPASVGVAHMPRSMPSGEKIESVSEYKGNHLFMLSGGRVLLNPVGVWTGTRLVLESGEVYEVR